MDSADMREASQEVLGSVYVKAAKQAEASICRHFLCHVLYPQTAELVDEVRRSHADMLLKQEALGEWLEMMKREEEDRAERAGGDSGGPLLAPRRHSGCQESEQPHTEVELQIPQEIPEVEASSIAVPFVAAPQTVETSVASVAEVRQTAPRRRAGNDAVTPDDGRIPVDLPKNVK